MFLFVDIQVPPLTTSMEDDIEFLRLHTNSRWEVIESKWEKTSQTRVYDMKVMKKLENVTAKYPLLAHLNYNRLLVRWCFYFRCI